MYSLTAPRLLCCEPEISERGIDPASAVGIKRRRSPASGTTNERGCNTKQEFGLIGATQWNPTTGYTYIGVAVSVPRIFSNPSAGWDRYLGECGESLKCVAAQESVQIHTWSTALSFEDGLTRITHHVHAVGEVTGATPNLLQWALAPTRDYQLLDLLSRAQKEGVLVGAHLKRAAEANCLRYDRAGKRLPGFVPAQLLALALAEPGWRGLVSPGDNPWAYLNKATRRIYARSYEETGSANPLEEEGLSPFQIDKRSQSIGAGDELFIENLRDVVLNSGCSADAASVMAARKIGKKWKDLPKYLTGLTGTEWDWPRVEAARASIRRKKGELRVSALAGSQWKARSSNAAIYRERVPGGALWEGSWTYSHSLQGANVDITREVIDAERKQLFVTK